MFSKKLQQAIDLFNENLFCLTEEDIIKQVDYFEHQVYQAIDVALARFDNEGSKAFNSIYDEVNALNVRLKTLHNVHLMYPNVYARQFNIDFFSEIKEEQRIHILKEHYDFFMNQCLDFSNDKSQKDDIGVLVRKILSMPLGQRLIIKLNQLVEKNNCRIKVKCNSNHDAFLAVRRTDAFPHTIAPKSIDSDLNPHKFFNYECKKYKFVELHYPNKFWEKPNAFRSEVSFGKKTCLTYQVAFLAIAHELIHVLHFFRGKDRVMMPFSYPYDKPHVRMLLNNMEELWTIDLGNISENKIREEHGINLRYSHMSAFCHSDGEYSLNEIKSTLTEEHAMNPSICFDAALAWEEYSLSLLSIKTESSEHIQRPGCCVVS